MAERTKAMVARVTPLRPIPRKSQHEQEINLHDPDDTLSAEDLNRPIQQWKPLSRISLPAKEDTDNTSHAISPVIHRKVRPDLAFASWARLDQTGKTIIMKEISEDLGSFQAACCLLSLEPNEAQEFLGNHEYEKRQALKSWEQLDHWRNTQELPDEDEDASGAGINSVSTTCTGQMCEFLSFMGLDRYSEIVTAWENKTVSWPPKVNTAKFNCMRLHQFRLHYPQTRDAFKTNMFKRSKPSRKTTPTPEVEYGMMAFRAPQHVEDGDISEVRIYYIVVPPGTVVMGPTGWKVLVFGGKYQFIYPGSDEEKPTNTSEFVISVSPIDEPPTKEKDGEQKPQHEAHALNNDSSHDKGEKHDHQNATFTNFDENTDIKSEGPEITASKTSFFKDAISHHQTMQEFDQQNLIGFQGNASHAPAPTEASIGDEYIKGREMFIDLINQTPSPTSEPPKVRCRSHQYDSSFMSNMIKDIKRWEDPEVAVQGFVDIITMGISMKSPDSTNEHQLLPQAREEETQWNLGNPQSLNQMQPTPATVEPAAIFPNPYQLEEEVQYIQPGADHLHANPQPKPRERNGANEKLSSSGDLPDGLMYQLQLPFGYRVKAPTGYETNFDSHHQGPNDGNSPPGVGGLYSFILPEAFQNSPDVQRHTLPEGASFRIYIAGDLIITRNKDVLSTTLDSDCFHQLTLTNGEIDIISEYGPHRIFNCQTLPGRQINTLQGEGSDEETGLITPDQGDSNHMDVDPSHVGNDLEVQDDIMDLDSDSEENQAESTDNHTQQEDPQEGESSSSDVKSESDSDTNLASPLREAKIILLPFKKMLKEIEKQELEDDRIAAEQAELEVQKQFRKEERRLKAQRKKELEAQQLARDLAKADDLELMGRGRRQKKRNTLDEKMGLVEYNAGDIEVGNSDDDWIPPRARGPRPPRTKKPEIQNPTPAGPPDLTPASSGQPKPSPQRKRKLSETEADGADES